MSDPEIEKLVAAAKAEESKLKGWFERYLNWIIAAGCFVVGAVVGHLL